MVDAGQEAYFPRYVRPQSLQTSANELGGIPASLAQADAVKTFGDLPLIVLTARLNTNPGWLQWQKELLELSSNSQQRFAENSGHIIQSDEPEGTATPWMASPDQRHVRVDADVSVQAWSTERSVGVLRKPRWRQRGHCGGAMRSKD